jgi:membrane-associated phospholipid phosphatase
VGVGFSKVDGARHAFSLSDPSISFPYHHDTVRVSVLFVVSTVPPAIITAVVSLIHPSGPAQSQTRSPNRNLAWRTRLWEWNAAWMGLGMALAGAYMLTEGLKDLAGKPRPFFLAVCNPDLSPEAITKYQVGGLGRQTSSAVPVVVDWHICRGTATQTDRHKTLGNAFSSWPSGHASFSWAGMLYLSLFICAKFGIWIPSQPAAASSATTVLERAQPEEDLQHLRTKGPNSSSNFSSHRRPSYPPLADPAAPPIYLLIIAFIPLGVALFISVSRWFDYHHHGIDIFSGALIGIFTAWLGFRWHHPPIQAGTGGGAWGPRSRRHAFWLERGLRTGERDSSWEEATGVTDRDPEGGEDAERGLPGVVGGTTMLAGQQRQGISDEESSDQRRTT